MKKATTFEVNGKKYTLMYNNRSLANLERSIGRSILSIMGGSATDMVRNMTIDVMAASIKYGLQDMPDGKDPYDMLDEICDNGYNLDALGGKIIEAWLETGFFTAGTPNRKATATKKA